MRGKLALLILVLGILLGIYVVAHRMLKPHPPIANSAPASVDGIYALIGWDETPSDVTWKNPYITGVVLRMYWRDLNPQKDSYDWSYIDTNIQKAQMNGKYVRLMIAPGFYSPD